MLADHLLRGHRIPTRPERPVGFMSWVLSHHGDLSDRPCALDDARLAEELAARKAQAARDHTQHLADRAAAKAALGGPGHTAAREVAARIGAGRPKSARR